jgi:hypothetical protein
MCKILDKRKQAKIQWLQNPNQNNEDNLHNVRREASRHFRNKKKGYLKAKINELETNSKNKNIRDLYSGISEFKRGYQPRINVVKDEKGDLVADSHSILARWRTHFSQLLNIHGVNDVRQTEVHMAEPLVPEPSAFEVEMAIEKLKRHTSPGIDQIPAELIKAGGRLRVFENRVLTRIFGPKRDDVTGEWRRLHNEELNDLYSSPNIIPVIKSRRDGRSM